MKDEVVVLIRTFHSGAGKPDQKLFDCNIFKEKVVLPVRKCFPLADSNLDFGYSFKIIFLVNSDKESPVSEHVFDREETFSGENLKKEFAVEIEKGKVEVFD